MRRLALLALLGSFGCGLAPARLLDEGGREFPRPGVLLVVSAGCPHCHRLARRISTGFSGGGPFPLGLLALEGSDAGREFLRTTHLSATVCTLQGDLRKWLKEMKIRIVPTLLFLDAHGQVASRSTGEVPLQQVRTNALRAGASAGPSPGPVDPSQARP